MPTAPERTPAGVLSLSLGALAGLLSLTAAVMFVLLRTTGIGPYRFPGESRAVPLVLEALGLVAVGLAVLRGAASDRIAAVPVAFAASGFLAVQAVAFAFGFDPTTVPLQLATVSCILAGLTRLLSHERSVAMLFAAPAAFVLGATLAIALIWTVDLM